MIVLLLEGLEAVVVAAVLLCEKQGRELMEAGLATVRSKAGLEAFQVS